MLIPEKEAEKDYLTLAIETAARAWAPGESKRATLTLSALLRYGPKETIDDPHYCDGTTFLQNTMILGLVSMVRTVLEYGANPNAKMPLHNENLDALQFLACYSAEIMFPRFEMMELLIEHCADITSRTESGETAFDIYRRVSKPFPRVPSVMDLVRYTVLLDVKILALLKGGNAAP